MNIGLNPGPRARTYHYYGIIVIVIIIIIIIIMHIAHLPFFLLTAVPATSSYPTNPRTLDEYTPHQYWSANFIYKYK